MEKIRSFIAIEIDASQQIKNLISELEETGINAKIVETKNMHLTLKFLGDTDTNILNQIEEKIKESVKSINPFEIYLKGVGVFPNTNYIKVFWIGIEDEGNLKQIAKEIDEKLNKIGFKKERREFSAHLTIARVKSAKNKEKLIELINKHKETEFQKIKVEKIILKKSVLTPQGPIYTNLKEIKIGE